MIGKVYLSTVDFYDSKIGKTSKKTRPILIVGGPRNNDYTALPISTISKRQNVDAVYDILLEPAVRTMLSLNSECFVRTHKQMPVHHACLYKELGDMKRDLPDLFLHTLSLMEQHQKELLNDAL